MAHECDILIITCDQLMTWDSSTDAGPGMEVPGDPLSHGRDSVNVSGHTIPAMLCGNQCAVLCDTEPTELEDLDG